MSCWVMRDGVGQFTPDPAPNLMFHAVHLKRACEAETEGHVDEELLRLGRHLFVGIGLLGLRWVFLGGLKVSSVRHFGRGGLLLVLPCV